MATSGTSITQNAGTAGVNGQPAKNSTAANKFALPPPSDIDASDKELMKEVRRHERENNPNKPPSQMAFLRGRIDFLRRAFAAGVPDRRIIQILNDNNIGISIHTLRAFWKASKLKRKSGDGIESNGDSKQEASNKNVESDGQSQAGAPKENAGEIASKTNGEERSAHNHGADKKDDGKGNAGSAAGGSYFGSNWDDDFEMDDSSASYKG